MWDTQYSKLTLESSGSRSQACDWAFCHAQEVTWREQDQFVAKLGAQSKRHTEEDALGMLVIARHTSEKQSRRRSTDSEQQRSDVKPLLDGGKSMETGAQGISATDIKPMI